MTRIVSNCSVQCWLTKWLTTIYSLLPHTDDWQTATAAQAYCLNDPVITYKVTAVAASPATGPLNTLISTKAPNIIIETIKRAEDGNGFIIRLYESLRQRGWITLTTAFLLARAEKVNLIEET